MSLTPVNIVEYWIKKNFVAIGEKTSHRGEFVGIQGVIFFFRAATQDATYIIETRMDPNDDWVTLADGTVPADQLTVIDIDFFIPEARLKITPVAVPMVFSAKAYGYPAVYSRLLNDTRPCRQTP